MTSFDAVVQSDGGILLLRKEIGMNVSEIRMQVMWNRLVSVVEEQALTLLRTAFSTSVRESGVLSAGVFDPRSRGAWIAFTLFNNLSFIKDALRGSNRR